MKKVEEMRQTLNELRTEIQNLADENKIKEAQAKMEEAKELKAKIEIQEELDAAATENMKDVAKNKEKGEVSNKTKESASTIRAMIKKMTGRSLTDTENALLLPTTENGTGENGEGYILPQDISTKINKKIREYRSARDVIGYIPTGALTGTFAVENFETVTGLVDFTDGVDGVESNDIKFANIKYALKEYAAFIRLSNTLLAMTDNDLIAYVAEIFARKAVVTENTKAFDVLRSNKTAKALTKWTDLASSINKDLDPAMLYGTRIVTNQDGFDALDRQLDGTGRPILQVNPTEPTKRIFKGYPIEVFSNSALPSTGKKAPIFYGNLKEGVKFVDYKGLFKFATSEHAGFMSNTTLARVIEFFDIVQCDASDKCYMYGTLTLE